MRLRFGAALAAVLLVLSGCIPYRQFGQEPAPSPSVVTAFDEILAHKLQDATPLAQVADKPKGTATMRRAIGNMNTAWANYLQPLGDGRMAAHPSGLYVTELEEGESLGDVCDHKGSNHRFPQTVSYPTYCPDFLIGAGSPAVTVVPPGYDSYLQGAAKDFGNQAVWGVTGLLASRQMSVHLRYEMGVAGVAWPQGDPFDECVGGMSLRALYPAGALDASKVEDALELVRVAGGSSDDPAQEALYIMAGFTSGSLESCV